MKIRNLLTDESKWCKGVDAQDCNGDEIRYDDPKAHSFCLVGALEVCYRDEGNIIYAIKDKIRLRIGDITRWNDAPERTFEDVRKLIEELNI